MKLFSAAEVAAALPYADLVNSLKQAFSSSIEAPQRHVHKTAEGDLLMLMPAWTKDWLGLKSLTLKQGNPAAGRPYIQGIYLLVDNKTGAFVAGMDGTELTRRRTAAASALASSFLSRPDSTTHLVVGTGSLSPHFAKAHRAVRPIATTLLWNRHAPAAERLAGELNAQGLKTEAVADLESAARRADIISCITSSTTALVKGEWLKPGTHLDLAGAYRPDMREVDGRAVAQARVFVDTLEGAHHEAGDLLQAASEGQFDFNSIVAELAGLCSGAASGRATPAEHTLFKSCGTAIEDLAAAAHVYLHHH